MATASDMNLTAGRQMKTQVLESAQSESGGVHGNKRFSLGASSKEREKKIGHRRVDEKTGLVTYKKKTTSELMAAIQLGMGQSVGGLSSKPERDLLMQDFGIVQSVVFPSEGSNMTPAHHYSDFRFKAYAPLAFRYFRELFHIRPDDFMLSLCNEPMTELSNPGAGGSIFYISADDEFIIKTAQHKEANFLQKLLPGYYMNLNQNPRTLLPKFYGLYCYQCGGKNIRFVVMNNILPSVVKLHEKYDLKGSTYKRKASKSERAKRSPTLKDLDFIELHPDGLLLEKDTYDALIKTIQRDCRVLESFKIMDYSLLVGVHNLDVAKLEKALDSAKSAEMGDGNILQQSQIGGSQSSWLGGSQGTTNMEADVALIRGKSMRTKLTQYSTPMESIQAEVHDILEEFDDEDIPPGGIPAKNSKGERLLIYLGIIDILQCYIFRKKFEHTFKSMLTDGDTADSFSHIFLSACYHPAGTSLQDTVSVTRPSFYSERFQKFFTNTVFKKAPSPLKSFPSKRKLTDRSVRTATMNEEHKETIPGTVGARPDLLMGSATPQSSFSDGVVTVTQRDIHKASFPATLDTDMLRSDQSFFQTVSPCVDISSHSQSEMSLRSGSSTKCHSPISVSECTPTYTEFTEGTPSYTASSLSCSSEVLDATVPNLTMDSDYFSPSSPTQTMANSTDTSYYGMASHLDSIQDQDSFSTVAPSAERYGNIQTVTASSIVKNKSITYLDVGKVKGEIVAEIDKHSQQDDQNSANKPRTSNVSHKTSDFSFSSQAMSVNMKDTMATSVQSSLLSERSDKMAFTHVNIADGQDELDSSLVKDVEEVEEVL